MSFYKKLMLLYCILITLLVGCFYTASYFVSRASLDERTKTYMNHIGDLTSLKIWQSFDELDTTIQRTIFDMYLTELLSNYNEKDAKERDTALSYLAGKVNQLVSLNPYVEAVDFYFYNGDLFITPSSRQIPDIFNSPYFWINNLNQKLEWIELDADGQTINGSKIVMDSKGRAIAVMVVKVNHRFLADQMTNLTDQFTFYLTDAQGTIIFTSSAEPGIIGTTWQNAPKPGIIRTARQVTVLHWMLYLETPSITFSAYVNQYGKSQIILTVVIVILGVITSLAMALSISRPIKRLTRQMRRIAAEDPDLSAPPALGDEIAFLEHSFYSMVKRIDSLINNVYNEKILRRESELKALQGANQPAFFVQCARFAELESAARPPGRNQRHRAKSRAADGGEFVRRGKNGADLPGNFLHPRLLQNYEQKVRRPDSVDHGHRTGSLGLENSSPSAAAARGEQHPARLSIY